MSTIEQELADWAKGRYPWQQYALRRIAIGQPFTQAEVVKLVDDIIANKYAKAASPALKATDISGVSDPNATVALKCIRDPTNVNALLEDRISRVGRPLVGFAGTQALDSGFLSLDDRSCKGSVRKPARPRDLSRGHRALQRDLARARLLSVHASEASARSRCVPSSSGVIPIRGFESGAGASIGAKASSRAEGGRVLRKRRTSSTIRALPERGGSNALPRCAEDGYAAGRTLRTSLG